MAGTYHQHLILMPFLSTRITNHTPFSATMRLKSYLKRKGISLFRYKDQVIFEENEILKPDNKPYTIFTPYKNRWMKKLSDNPAANPPVKAENAGNFTRCSYSFPSLQETGFAKAASG